MALYCYIKAQPKLITKTNTRALPVRNIIRFLPYFTLAGGLIMLLIIALPMLSHKLLLFSKENKKLVAPIPEEVSAEAKGIISPLQPVVLSANDDRVEPEIINEVDYDQIANWFPTAPLPRTSPSKITDYSLSIPKIKIKDASVTMGGSKVKETLIHYPGTALPGEFGNTVIFGHSVLPIFYNPKNYETIFSLLPTLEKGDKIYIYFDGIEYVYQVEDYFEVKPENVQVLEQRFNEQILSLVTCVPPGTYKSRGIIKARLVGL